jgi:hypothetical protein
MTRRSTEHCCELERPITFLPAVAVGNASTTYRAIWARFLPQGLSPQTPEKNRFFGHFSV